MPGFDRQATKQTTQRGGRGRASTVQRPATGNPLTATQSPGSVLGLQRSIGNTATSAYLQRSESAEEEEEEPMQLQRLLQRSESAEEEEEEPMQLQRSSLLQRSESAEEEEEEPMQLQRSSLLQRAEEEQELEEEG